MIIYLKFRNCIADFLEMDTLIFKKLELFRIIFFLGIIFFEGGAMICCVYTQF